MKKYLTFLLLFVMSYQVEAEIIEASHFSELCDHIAPDTLILLDIDDTLLVPEQMLGCDEWFQTRFQKYQESEMDSSDALETALSEWEAVRHVTKMKIVEPGTEELVRDLQQKNYIVMGLTTQGLALATRTSQQLRANQIDLKKTAPFKEDHYISLDGHGALYRNGILFTAGGKKGEALFQLLEKNNFFPKRIVFINDKTTHLADVEETAERHNVEFVGLRYAYADIHKAAFSLDVADYQFTHSSFDRILSDQEAVECMEGS